ncbi:hypothetical protein HD554DRAFT_2040566 [Boletus coccyginus]|nr:hypothetical protein HD554DRAFT_2040566 [Boletus coccyginus]
MSASLSLSDVSELQYWLDLSLLDSGTTPDDNDAWLLKLHNHTNQGPFLSTPTLILNANILAEIIQILCATPLLEDIALPVPTLSSDLHDHPCHINTIFKRSLIHEAGAPAWGWLLAEMLHLVYQHTKTQPMGILVPDTIFKCIHKVTMMQLARSLFRLKLEPAQWGPGRHLHLVVITNILQVRSITSCPEIVESSEEGITVMSQQREDSKSKSKSKSKSESEFKPKSESELLEWSENMKSPSGKVTIATSMVQSTNDYNILDL